MARDFFYDRSQQKNRRKLVWGTILVTVLLAVDLVSGGALRSMVRTGAAKLWVGSAEVRNAIFGEGYFVTHASLARENTALRDALAKAQEDAASYTALKDENDSLRALVHLAGTTQGITAPVVSSTFSSPYGTFLVGAGQGSVNVGDIVLTSDGFAVGVVSEVNAHTSTVTSILAPGAKHAVIIDATAAEIEGRGGGNARANLPRDAKVSVGSVVTSPEYGGKPVGVVGHVDSSPAAAQQVIYIGLPVDLSTLKFVYIAR